jgi:hypothetical protein
MTTPSSTMSETNLRSSLELIEVKPGVRFSLATLREMLPDAETLLFFGKVYELDVHQLSRLMSTVLQSSLVDELFGGDHSLDLQDYLVEDLALAHLGVDAGEITLSPSVPHGEILPELWKSLETDVAKAIKDVAAKLESVVAMMPGKQGSMVFKSMLKMNRQRPTMGVHEAQIYHAPTKENLIILDDSGSMTADTVRKIIDDVVAMSYMANAHFALVSDTARHWEPGTYDSDAVLREGQFNGTHYEQLKQLLDRDWGVVVTIADYDSSPSAKTSLARKCKGHIDQVLDISLVNRPSFLSECVGQFADEVRPLLIATGGTVRQSFGY